MVLKKDKVKVVDEVWTEDRVKEFLNVKPAEHVEADFHMLMKAYQSMRADDFSDFIGFFLAEGHDINAKGPQGQTVLSVVSQHRNSEEFAEALKANGAE